MYAYMITDYYVNEFNDTCTYYAVVADLTERSITYTREYPTVTQLRSAVWFNLGPAEWVGPRQFEILELAILGEAA